MQIDVNSNIKNYTIQFVNDLSFLQDISLIKSKKIVIDENVWRIYRAEFATFFDDSDVIVLPISEDVKNIDSVLMLYDKLMQTSAKKNLTLVSIGGGITQDITGFVASTLYRGIKWIFVPTTLLAQSDSCMGSKTSLNYKEYKNLVGTFFPPDSIYISVEFTKTLPDIDFHSGLGEIIKLYLMGGQSKVDELPILLPKLINRDSKVLRETVFTSLKIKHSYIADDEFDTGKRNLLNFGHCFGHAIETCSNYAIPHGIAVTIGIALADIIAVKRGCMRQETCEYIFETVLKSNIIGNMSKAFFDKKIICDALKMDKKRVGTGLPLVILNEDMSLVKLIDMTEQEVEYAIDVILQLLEV